MQIKLIFTREVVHLASFWKWGFLNSEVAYYIESRIISERVSSGPFTDSVKQLTFVVTATIKTLLQAGWSLFDLNISYNRVVISDWVYYKVQPSKRGEGGIGRDGCNRKRGLIYFIMVNIVLGLTQTFTLSSKLCPVCKCSFGRNNGSALRILNVQVLIITCHGHLWFLIIFQWKKKQNTLLIRLY